MGLNHLRILDILLAKNQLSIYDSDPKKLKTALKKYNIKQNDNLNELIKKADKIIIATSTSSHFELLCKCIEFNKKSIFVEKPYVQDLSQANKINRLIEKYDSKIFVGLIENFNSSVNSILKSIDTKTILNLELDRQSRVNDNSNKDIDVIFDLMIHDLSLAILFNGNIESFKIDSFKKNNNLVYVKVFLTHKNQSLSTIISSKISDKKARSLNILGKNYFLDANLLESEFSIYKSANVKNKELYKVIYNIDRVQADPSEPLLSELNYYLKNYDKDKSSFSRQFSLKFNFELIKLCNTLKKNAIKCGIDIS